MTVCACLLLTGCPNKQPASDKTAAVDAVAAAIPVVDAEAITLTPFDGGLNVYDVVSDVKKRSDPRYSGLPLFEKLYVERVDRPASALKADLFYDALVKDGVKVTNRRQVAGFTVNAGYCLKADAEPDVDLTVCEFDDEAKLATGKKVMLKLDLPKREIVTRRSSTVAVNRLGESKECIEMAKKIVIAARGF